MGLERIGSVVVSGGEVICFVLFSAKLKMGDNSDTCFMLKEFLTDFIEMYKQHPALRNTKSKEYCNKNLKNKGYEALIAFCRNVYPLANREFVTK
jgi:hypothetical protein